MNEITRHDKPLDRSRPWYQQFWPLFLIALPLSAVMGCMYSLYIAFKYADDVVSDNYYKEGLAINKVYAQREIAIARNISAELEHTQGILRLVLNGVEAPDGDLLLTFIHPAKKAKDFVLELKQEAKPEYTLFLNAPLSGHWRVKLHPKSKSWLIEHDWHLEYSSKVQLN